MGSRTARERMAALAVAASALIVQTACGTRSSSPCQPFYASSFQLPAAVNSLDCTLSLSNLRRYDVPAPAPGQTTSCSPSGGTLSCTRNAPTDGTPQTISAQVATAQVAAFEQQVGPDPFTASVTCGSIEVVSDEEQNISCPGPQD